MEPNLLMDFKQYLNDYPCKHCGGHYNAHDYLLDREIKEARGRGYIVLVCETSQERGAGEGSTSFTRIFQPPENPCDDDFMREISS